MFKIVIGRMWINEQFVNTVCVLVNTVLTRLRVSEQSIKTRRRVGFQELKSTPYSHESQICQA